MAYQFFHIETYSTAQTKVKGTDNRFSSSARVFGEARRAPKYSGNVGKAGKVYRLGGKESVAQLKFRHTALQKDLKETINRKDGSTYEHKLLNILTRLPSLHCQSLSCKTALKSPNNHARLKTVKRSARIR
ncbi:MAG: hypothetical protein ACRBB0_00090 [Pelagimonas sp.]|uniref:hypothetical protein n=1 Tax=Pelagimonas sp. TaxID=2073170 RepID=UPI003D6BB582